MIGVVRLAAVAAPILGGAAVIAWRVRETRRPVTAPGIVLPPLAMSTGFAMFLTPSMRVPWPWALTALVLGGLVLGWPLARSSSLERAGDVIVLRRSRGFLAILLALLALRIALHDYVGHVIPARQTASLFFLLAFGMIVRWRVGMYAAFRRLQRRFAEPDRSDVTE